ncbi:hypothetical protein [Pseudomonas mangiferae]|uniref:Uncharacterized protein n=1 Tax=Pseudomonas mangiferae TaxID=2593654 RepID=A0A553H1M7_9PSED|nr:hypothetical protein [Pseudomonas mangiferae]TRX75657.1 hypothetical protein FM069_07915 [Pseudomonas mangiferae]
MEKVRDLLEELSRYKRYNFVEKKTGIESTLNDSAKGFMWFSILSFLFLLCFLVARYIFGLVPGDITELLVFLLYLLLNVFFVLAWGLEIVTAVFNAVNNKGSALRRFKDEATKDIAYAKHVANYYSELHIGLAKNLIASKLKNMDRRAAVFLGSSSSIAIMAAIGKMLDIYQLLEKYNISIFKIFVLGFKAGIANISITLILAFFVGIFAGVIALRFSMSKYHYHIEILELAEQLKTKS